MKKSLVALGVFFVVAAIVVVSIFFLLPKKVSATFQATRTCETVYNEPKVAASREYAVFPDWNISAHFNENEKLIVYFSRPNTEGIPDGEEDLAIMFVNIIDPSGGSTTFNVSFSRTTFYVGLEENDGDLLVESPVNDIGGIVQHSGEYTARIYTYSGLVPYYYTNSSTMRRLELDRVEPTLLYTVEVCYHGTEPIYEVKLRDTEGDLLDGQPVLEQNGILSYQSSDNNMSHVVVTWAGGSAQVNIED
jgi:hypothetical protein